MTKYKLSGVALWTLGGVLLLALLTSACGGETVASEADSPAASQAPPVTVELKTAAYETIPKTTRASGSVEPLRSVSPGTKILGRVDQVLVREGDRIEKGALLARLESRDLEAAVRQAQAAVRMADANLENARAQCARMTELHGRGSVTDKTLEDATANCRVTEAAHDQAEANLAAAEVALGYAEVNSPIAGWVVEKRIEAGDMATPGSPLFTIEDLSRVKVSVQVPEADVVGLHEGAPARVEVLDRELEATVDRVVPSGDPASRTFAVKLILANDDASLKSGMFARVAFERGEQQVLRVEKDAIVHRGQLEGLYVAGDDGLLRLRWVKTGRASNGSVEILSGLSVGERYAVNTPADVGDGVRYKEKG